MRSLSRYLLVWRVHWSEEWQSSKMRPPSRYSLVGRVAEAQDEAGIKILMGLQSGRAPR